MVSLTLPPLAPWQAAHTAAATCLPASTSAAWAACVTNRRAENPSTRFIGFPLVGLRILPTRDDRPATQPWPAYILPSRRMPVRAHVRSRSRRNEQPLHRIIATKPKAAQQPGQLPLVSVPSLN